MPGLSSGTDGQRVVVRLCAGVTSSRRLEQRVTQEATDSVALIPAVQAVEQRLGEAPLQVSADSGFFAIEVR